ncbi:MAG: hypothetical protein ACM33B_00165 [Pseudomonadota bacterium]
MRRVRFHRRPRNRAANAVEQILLRIVAAIWVLRIVLRHARPAGR